jgi:methylthioribose-1-phosphate isomerase
LIADNTAAKLMADGQIDLVITGADRIALNGDTANKIGTFNLAVLAKYHQLPFYVAAPKSTFDLTIKDSAGIRIEMREVKEVTSILFKKVVAPEKAKALNPAFDITPHQLISGIITDNGIIRKPYSVNILKVLEKG